ncbi:unnamed protein product [Rangifer tarandus platyrhynchus]|uniref:Uncharacterized protein n=1 Tax=Rangifer tarandus platyrhynchus TaxID=3082113 RepID=A0ABN8XMI2_RANTA|nr:unnamed protein product [Rangifer tarandus platyrhynchus]
MPTVCPSVHSISHRWSPQASAATGSVTAKAVLDSSPPPRTPSSRPAAPQPPLHHPEGCQMGVHPQLLHSRQLPARCRTPLSWAQALGARPLLPCPAGGPLPSAGLTWGSGTWLRRSCSCWRGCVAFLNAVRPCWGPVWRCCPLSRPAEQLYLWAPPPPPQPALSSPVRSQCLQHHGTLARTGLWNRTLCPGHSPCVSVHVCARARVHTYALSVPLHLWFSAVSFQTPVDLADNLCNPGDPPEAGGPAKARLDS